MKYLGRSFTILPLVVLLLECAVYAVDNPTARWIVVYKSHSQKNMAVQARGGRTRHTYNIIPGYAADLNAAEVDQIRKDPSVAFVEPDAVRYLYQASTAASAFGQFAPYGLDLVHARDVWPYTKGAAVKVADLDTGIDLTHPDKGSIVASKTFTNLPVQDSSNGHGTHTAGTIAAPDNSLGVVGVAPQASLLIAQVFDSAGSAYDSDLIAAIDWALQNGAKVINMSLGGPTYDLALSQACANAVAAGCVVVAAAGNDSTSTPSYPASYPSVISVSAIDQYKQVASFSNYGSAIAFCAPGVGVFSSVPVGSGSVTEANWSGTEHQTTYMTGSANGSVTAGAIYCGLGDPSDFPASVSGKIAHIRRGTLTFAAKVSNAVAAGAVGVIISNNAPGQLTGGTLNGTTSVPVVTVSQADGDDLQARNGVTVTIINQQPSDYAAWDGTSMASPHVAGVAALLVAARHGNITPAQIKSALQATAQDLGSAGRDNYYGYGLVNAYAALGNVIPIVQAVSAGPYLVEGGDSIAVNVQLSISTGVSAVTANGVGLSLSGGMWTGNAPASPAFGIHNVDVAVADVYGNTNHNTTLTYKTARRVATTGKSLNAQITTAALSNYIFEVVGKASQVTTNSFVINDGSGYPVTVNATGHTIKTNEFARARGVLLKGVNGVSIQTVAAKVAAIK